MALAPDLTLAALALPVQPVLGALLAALLGALGAALLVLPLVARLRRQFARWGDAVAALLDGEVVALLLTIDLGGLLWLLWWLARGHD